MGMRNSHPSVTNPLVLGTAVSAIVAGLVGAAAVVGLFPSAHSQKVETSVQNSPPAAAQRRDTPRDRVCASCGTLTAVRMVEITGNGTGLGALAGGLTGAVVGSQLGKGDGNTAMTVLGAAGGALAGNEIEKNVKKRVTYRVTVHMDDGSFRTVSQPSPPPVARGGRVRIIDGAVLAHS
ncbi:MAG: glycine zipper 2TM domain-containing protein [Betaproteobacteria bacterium]|nr:glycine zipper 2TM domain-containing protein [Betaproteobacteria bacterium]